MLERALCLVEQAETEMQSYYDDRSEPWLTVTGRVIRRSDGIRGGDSLSSQVYAAALSTPFPIVT